MPKLGCICGATINLSPIPNPHSFILIEEAQYEELIDAAEVAAKSGRSEYRIFDVFQARKPKPEIVECPVCGRLAVFKDMSDQICFWYSPEKPCGEGRIQSIYQEHRCEKEPNKAPQTVRTLGPHV